MSNIFRKNFSHCFATFRSLPTIDDEGNETEEAIKNFNSLYGPTVSASTSSSSDDFSDIDAVPDLSTVLASQRFFFSSPGHSNSIVDSSGTPSTLISGGVAVQTDSPDPFVDFRQSMQEMMEAHELGGAKADWDFLRKLLLCYLNLNPKHTHDYIFGAFSDLIVSLVSSPSALHRITTIGNK